VILGAVETGVEAAVNGLAGMRAERHGRLLSLARCARERQVAEWALGRFQWNWTRCCSSGLGGRRGLSRSIFFLLTSFPINSKALV
jgi:hypothetical protein